MAKSLRSKWKRKMRAIKRERYGVKERAKLDEMVKKAREHEKNGESDIPFVQFVDIKKENKKKEEQVKGKIHVMFVVK